MRYTPAAIMRLTLVAVLVAVMLAPGCRRTKKRRVAFEEDLSYLEPDVVEYAVDPRIVRRRRPHRGADPHRGREGRLKGERGDKPGPHVGPLQRRPEKGRQSIQDELAIEKSAAAALDGVERATEELRLTPGNCVALAHVLRRLEGQGDLLFALKPAGAPPFEHRGERAAWELGQTLEEMEIDLQRCGERADFLRIMESP